MARKKAGGTTTPTRRPDATAGKTPRPTLASGPLQVAAQGAILKDDDRLIIVVRVTDAEGVPVTGLKKSNFQLWQMAHLFDQSTSFFVVEIENLLYQHPKVTDVAIVAMPDPRLGERACAFVVPAADGSPLTLAEVQDYLGRAGTSKYYWPERIEHIDALPRNVVGKIQKNLLREQAAALVAAEHESNAAAHRKENA